MLSASSLRKNDLPLWLHWHRSFKVWKVFANNEADVVKEAGKGGGLYCPYIAINGRDDWIFNEVDEQNIPVPPTYDEVVAAPKFRNVRINSTNRRDEELFFWFLKLKGLYIVPALDRLQYTWYQSRAVQRCQPPEGHCLR